MSTIDWAFGWRVLTTMGLAAMVLVITGGVAYWLPAWLAERWWGGEEEVGSVWQINAPDEEHDERNRKRCEVATGGSTRW